MRAHDFAVLRSVGMGERDLRRMPALECTRTAALEVPWAHVVGAVALVALALLASCAHALRRLRAAPLTDALRTE